MAQRDYRSDLERNANTDAYSRKGQGLKPITGPGTKLAQLKRLRPLFDNLGSIGTGVKFEAALPENLLGAIDGVVHLTDPDVAELLQRIDDPGPDDEQMAKRVIKLKRTQFPNSPLTELMTYDYFTQSNIQFAYQVPLNGGRQSLAGQVLDFATFDGGFATGIAIQGDYWHSRPDVAQSDEADRISGLGQLVNGQPLKKYLAVWEKDLYRDYKKVLNLAVAGQELSK
jgi:hypothetical protein